MVVGHVHRGHGEPALQLDEFGAGLDAQLGIEVRQRLVHQVHLRAPDDRPSHGHPLALATRQVLRLAVELRLGGGTAKSTACTLARSQPIDSAALGVPTMCCHIWVPATRSYTLQVRSLKRTTSTSRGTGAPTAPAAAAYVASRIQLSGVVGRGILMTRSEPRARTTERDPTATMSPGSTPSFTHGHRSCPTEPPSGDQRAWVSRDAQKWVRPCSCSWR